MPAIPLQTLRPHTGSPRVRRVMTCPNAVIFEAGNTGTDYPNDGDGDMITVQTITAYPSVAVYAVDYAMEPVTATGSFFVRVLLGGWHDAGLNDITTPPQITLIQPYINQIARGAALAPLGTYDLEVDRAWDFYTDPADGAPWTAAKVDAQRWGFYLVSTLADANQTVFSAGANKLHDMRLELYPSPVPAVVGKLVAGPVHAGLSVSAAGSLRAGPVRAGLGVNAAGHIRLEE